MTDHCLAVFRDDVGWRWVRFSSRGEPVAVSGRRFTGQRACLLSAVLTNRKPYRLLLHGGVAADYDVRGLGV